MDGNHPVAVEVKDKANDLWHAVVQNLQQVRMLRGNVANLKSHFENKRGTVGFKGAWGLVLAYRDYYENTAPEMRTEVDALLSSLVEKTEARIILGAVDRSLAGDAIAWQGGYWPTSQPI